MLVGKGHFIREWNKFRIKKKLYSSWYGYEQKIGCIIEHALIK